MALGNILELIGGLYGNLSGDVAPGEPVNITLETTLTPPIVLVGAGSEFGRTLQQLLKPTVRLNGRVLYAPEGEAPATLGTIAFLGILAGVVMVAARLMRRK